jgi:hypothetical protein
MTSNQAGLGIAFLWHAYLLAYRLGLLNKKPRGKYVTLTKAFDPTALMTALKAQGIADAEKLVNDSLPVIFDWLNTSIAMDVPSPFGVIASTVLTELESKATDALNAVEKTL